MEKIKTKLKEWLGVSELENLVGQPKKEKTANFLSFVVWPWEGPKDDSLHGKYERLQTDFEELDKKFDDLEKFLQIEYFKNTEETQVYEWADKKHTSGFRKTKPYEEVKKSKEKGSDDN